MSVLCFGIGQPSNDPLDVDYVPSIFSHTSESKKDPQRLRCAVERAERSQIRQSRKRAHEAAEALLHLGTEATCERSSQTTPVMMSKCTQTDLTSDELTAVTDRYSAAVRQQQYLHDISVQFESALASAQQQVTDLQRQLTEVTRQLAALQADTQQPPHLTMFGVDIIQHSDVKTKFYTGLPNYNTFQLVVSHAAALGNRSRTKLTVENEIFLTLVKLRRNPCLEDIAYRCNLSVSSVTNIFHFWLDVLYRLLGGLIVWPESDRMQLPSVFQNKAFRRVRCIIDCTEIFLDRPSGLKARAQTYSNYKRHNAVKLLIGISPSGCVIFLSPCWGGRASDRVITMQSGLIDKLLPGDVVLADRGFTMKDDFAVRGVELMVPAFTRGKKQLSAEDVEKSRQMSRARIHVERVIGRVKDFRILRDTLPIALVRNKGYSLQTAVEKIVVVVCSIVNMNKAIL